uniref:Reverse transcriptase domain-containing protein n=1 Tax=Astyanax mexicanus TaxID=7994 RepID=A0A3B1J8J0_ASTMX
MLKQKISFGSLNVRGLKDIVKRKALFLFSKGQNLNCFLFQETHSSSTDETFWANQWGDRILFSHGTNRSGGVAICFNHFPGDILTHKGDKNGHWLAVVTQNDNLVLIIVNVYGFGNDSLNRNLLDELSQVILEYKTRYLTDHVILGGDWNITPNEWLDRWPPRLGRQQYNTMLNIFMTDNNLTDVWRVLNPGHAEYSWIKPNGQCKSRLDYWLISDYFLTCTTKSAISKAPLSDHCYVSLIVGPSVKTNRHKGYWKFNASLLDNEEYCARIKKVIKEVEADHSIIDDANKWDFLKYKIRLETIYFSKELRKKEKQYESDLFREINKMCNSVESNSPNLMELQTKLDALYLKRAHGAFIRARARWMEDGEKNSSYFSRLEKSRQQRNSITTLLINDQEYNDDKTIETKVFNFFSNLYSSYFSIDYSNDLFQKIQNKIPQIEESFKHLCESEIRLEELEVVVFKMQLNKSPGTDGLTANFYRFFWNDIKNILFRALHACIVRKTLTPSMKEGLISLIPKSGKDKRLINNLRPITLLNTDYKILSGALAARLKRGISAIISETQSGFLKDCSIHNNIRLVLDLLDYSDLFNEGGYMLFLDFYKAFDCVEHPFIMQTLAHFGFGPKFLNIVEMLYNNINSSVSLARGTSPRFQVKRGIRQGCPASPLLFIMVAEMLSILIKSSNIEGIDIFGKKILISQLADDTTLFLKDSSQIPLVLQTIDCFSKASGLLLNIDKCEILTIHEYPLQTLYNIKVKKEVKYLGILICKDKAVSEKNNMHNNIEKCKLILNKWIPRDITIFGRTLLTKMDSLSRLIYPASSLAMPPDIIKAINKINFNFVWKNKCHYIRREDMVKNYEEGGVKVIDFSSMNGVLKLNWLRAFCNDSQSFWCIIPNVVFQNVGGIDFLLRCDFDYNKLPIKLSDFHQQVLLYWKLLYKHNFTPPHFMDDNGDMLSFKDFCLKFNVVFDGKSYNKLINAIPAVLKSMVKEDVCHSKTSPALSQLYIEDTDFNSEKMTNRFIRRVLQKELYPGQVKRQYIVNDYGLDIIYKIRTKYIYFPLPPKVKEVHFKILNDIYPTKYFIKSRFKLETDGCIFCSDEEEDLDHLFFQCHVIQDFWCSLWDRLHDQGFDLPALN